MVEALGVGDGDRHGRRRARQGHGGRRAVPDRRDCRRRQHQGAAALDRRRAAEGHDQARLTARVTAHESLSALEESVGVRRRASCRRSSRLPNFFGDDEAVQVSRTDGVAMDAPALEQVRTTLMEGGIEYLSAELEGTSALVRVETPRAAGGAATLLTKAFPNHVVALTLSPRTPGWLRWLGLEPMLLGLDLRGGVHFLYQVDSRRGRFAIPRDVRERTAHAVPRRRISAQRRSRRSARACEVAIVEPADMDRAEEIIRQLDYRRSAAPARPAHEPAHHRPRAGRRPARLQRAAHGGRDSRAPGFRDPAEHGDDAQSRQRARRRRGRRAAPGPRPDPRRAARHPGPGDGEGHLGLDGDARVPSRRPRRTTRTRRERRGRAPLGSELPSARGRLADPAAARHHRLRRSAGRCDRRRTRKGQPVVNVRLDATGGAQDARHDDRQRRQAMAVLFIEDRPA